MGDVFSGHRGGVADEGEVSNIIPLTMAVGDRKVEFKMVIDADFMADQHLATELREFGCAEPEVVAAMFHIVRPGDFVIDGGANTGFFTCILSKLVGETGRVLAYEPEMENVKKLRVNLDANDVKNVQIDYRPLWETGETVTFHRAADSGFGSLVPNENTSLTVYVRGTRLDCSDRPRLIKLDIEGAEERVLRTAIKPDRCPYIIAELNEQALNPFGCTSSSFRKLMDDFGFETFALHPKGNFPIYVPLSTKIITQWQNTNVLFSTINDVAAAWPEIYIER